MRVESVLATSMLVGMIACDAGPDAASVAAVRDSAGIAIVENQPRAVPSWSIESDPTLDLGVAAGDRSLEFHQVADAIRLAGGSIAVLNAGTFEVRTFDASGAFLWTYGREGSGPGEFQLPSDLATGPDGTIRILDRMRVISIDLRGAFVTEETVPRSPISDLAGFGAAGAQGLIAEEHILVRAQDRSVPPPASGRFRPILAYALLRSGSDTARVLGTFGFTEQQVVELGEIRRFMAPAFGKSSRVGYGTNPPRVYIGDDATYQISAYALDGALDRLIRLDRPNQPVDATTVEHWKQYQRERYGGTSEVQSREEMWRAMEVAEVMPAFGQIHGDLAGHVWVERYEYPETRTRILDVFDSTGQLIAVASLPQGLQISEIGRDYILGIWTDESDVEHVRLYTLIKP